MSDAHRMSGASDMAERAQALLESLTVVVSARVVQYADRPAQVHVLSTSDVPVSEVIRTVASALLSGLGLEVAASQISVAQSRLPANDLARLVGRDVAHPPPATAAPPVASVTQQAPAPDHAPTNGLASVLEEPVPSPAPEPAPESWNSTHTAQPSQSAIEVAPRFKLLDFHVVRDDTGGLDVGVRLRGNGGSVERRRTGADTEEGLQELPAAAALEAVQELIRPDGWSDGRQVTLKLLGARRLRTAQHNLVVVLVEAVVDGQTLPLAGAASADDGVERASIMATLQATNPLVTGFQVAQAEGRTGPPRRGLTEDRVLAWPLSEAQFR